MSEKCHDRTSVEWAGSSGRYCSDVCAESALYRDVRNVEKRCTYMAANHYSSKIGDRALLSS
jgi:hypothetical protein